MTRLLDVAGRFFTRWSEAGCMTRAAALAYYAVFSLAPILVIVLAIASVFADESAVTGALVAEVRRMIGNEGAKLVGAMLGSARDSPRGFHALVALAALLVGATTAFAELKDSLDAVFRSTASTAGTWWQWVRARLLSFGLVVTLAFGAAASLAVVMAWVYYAALAFLAGAVIAAVLDDARAEEPALDRQRARLRGAPA